MTWYGMTDLRASLGLENTKGPVLGALLSEEYTDVVILGFTNPEKPELKAEKFQQKLELECVLKYVLKGSISYISNRIN